MREFGYIDWLRKRVVPGSRTTIGIGDDAAGYRFTEGREALITTDMLLDGSCFILAEAGPVAVGRKALAVNLSDIAAMAGVPRAAVVSLALPRRDGAAIARGVFEGIEALAKEFNVEIIGGDTNSWDGPLAISITLFGEATERPPVRRSGAKAGDWIFVTGPLGGSIRGKHLSFKPRITEAIDLNRLFDLHAMIDLSDGLSRDLFHVCEESGVGACIHAEWIPISDDARLLSERDGVSPLEHALNDGEDFELCFCVPPEEGSNLADRFTAFGCTHIGFIKPAGRYEIIVNAAALRLEVGGFEHLME